MLCKNPHKKPLRDVNPSRLLSPRDLLRALKKRPKDSETQLLLAVFYAVKKVCNSRWWVDAGALALEAFNQTYVELRYSIGTFLTNREFESLAVTDRQAWARLIAGRVTRRYGQCVRRQPQQLPDYSVPGNDRSIAAKGKGGELKDDSPAGRADWTLRQDEENTAIKRIDLPRVRARSVLIIGAESTAWLLRYEDSRWTRPSPYSGSDHTNACRLRKKLLNTCKDLAILGLS